MRPLLMDDQCIWGTYGWNPPLILGWNPPLYQMVGSAPASGFGDSTEYFVEDIS